MGKSRRNRDKSSYKSMEKSKDSSSRSKPTLSDALTYGLLKFPVLVTELPLLLTALDNSQAVMADSMEDIAMKAFLSSFMSYLPVSYVSGEGWIKNKQTQSLSLLSSSPSSSKDTISSYIISQLLKIGAIVQPMNQSSAQSTASRFTVPKFISIFEKYPLLLDEIEPILQTIHDGGVVNVNQIENEDVCELLTSFLSSIGLEDRDGDNYKNDNNKNKNISSDSNNVNIESGYSLPLKQSERGIALDILKQYLNILSSYRKFESYFMKIINNQSVSHSFHNSNDSDSNQNKNRNLSSLPYSSSSSSSDNSSSDDDNEDEKDNLSDREEDDKTEIGKALSQTSNNRIIGPAIPSVAQFQYAQSQAMKFHKKDEDNDKDENEDEENDEDIGPALLNRSFDKDVTNSSLLSKKDHQNHNLSVLPIGYIGVPLIRDDNNNNAEEEDKDKNNLKPRTDTNITIREEWMLTPGERDPFSGIKDGTNRKFQGGKTAKKLAESLTQQREEYEKQANSEEALKTKAIIEEYNLKRGPSLMEQHLEKSSKIPKIESNERQPFDRERDVLSHKKMDNYQVQKLVENAQKLDSRFSKGFVQKSSI